MSDPNNYTVAWICAIETEYLAAQLCLDEEHPKLQRRLSPQDTNTYALGKVAGHNVVIASLPDGSYGTSSAAVVAVNLLRSFPSVRIGLMVGIGGGAPSPPDRDIRLGDIVVSSPRDGKGGVLQYDFGKTIQEQDFQETRFLNQPPAVLRAAVIDLKVEHRRRPGSLENDINGILENEEEDLREELSRPGASSDRLYRSTFVHPANKKSSCLESCGDHQSTMVPRTVRTKRPHCPVVHYGLIASGNQLMKDSLRRDELANKENVLCFEMEAAGLMNDFPCLVVRGICDYSDTHKNDEWQGYAALAAATYATDLLKRIPPDDVDVEEKIGDVLSGISKNVEDVRSIIAEDKTTRQKTREVEEHNKCLERLRSTDPRDDKKRIEKTKGGLFKDSYRWILENPDFRTWQEDHHCRLLWVKGDPGKGKTMLVCGIVDELAKLVSGDGLLSYFFCQSTDSRINTATAVLRGLIYLLVDQQPSLISHVQKKYDHAPKSLFEDVNSWVALSEIFTNILRDPGLMATYLIIDALDECTTGLDSLLELIVSNLSSSPLTKWIVSSRTRLDIEQHLTLADAGVKLNLEITQNAKQVAHAVNAYIDYKVARVKSLQDDGKERDEVRNAVSRKANGTFLWAALVIKELEKPECLDPTQVVEDMPAGLNELYDQMLNQIQQLPKINSDYCRRVLAAATQAFRPLRVAELSNLSGLPQKISKKARKIVAMCGSFLTIQDDFVYLIHESIKDYLIDNSESTIFPSGYSKGHRTIFSSSIDIMVLTLRRDMYNLHAPGSPIEKAKPPASDPLSGAAYSCAHWVDHLYESVRCGGPGQRDDLTDGGKVDIFLRKKYIYWLEALGLLKSIPLGVLSVTKLEHLLQDSPGAPNLINLVRDARRFILYHQSAIGSSPLQVYASALLFSPGRSPTRVLFEREQPEWVVTKPTMQDEWSACLQTLEGHSDGVSSVAFSPDLKLLASASRDHTVKIWDISTGEIRQTLEGHISAVSSVAFSPDSKLVVSASEDHFVKIWDTATGECCQTHGSRGSAIIAVRFCTESELVAEASRDRNVRIDCFAKTTRNYDMGSTSVARLVTFSLDSHPVTASKDLTVKAWTADIRSFCQAVEHDGEAGTLEGHRYSVSGVTFSPDLKLLVQSHQGTVKIYCIATGGCRRILDGISCPDIVTFSHDSELLALSYNRSVTVYCTATGGCRQILNVETYPTTVAFSSDSKFLALSDRVSAKNYCLATGKCRQTLNGHTSSIEAIAFSPDSTLVASASHDRTLRIWDNAIAKHREMHKAHKSLVLCIAVSPDSRLVASGSTDYTVKIWDTATGECLMTLEGHSSFVQEVAFSSDSALVVSVSGDRTLKIWDTATGDCHQTAENSDLRRINAVAFSPDSTLIATGTGVDDLNAALWDAATGEFLWVFDCGEVLSVSFSPDSKLVAFGPNDGTVQIRDAVTGRHSQTLEGHGSIVLSIAFSPDSKLVVSASEDHFVKIWDIATRECRQTVDTGQRLGSISFDPTSSHLWTRIGAIDLSSTLRTESSVTVHQKFHGKGYGISYDDSWITRDGENVLRLPPEYRPFCSDVGPVLVAIGCASGQVVIMKFSAE